MDLQAACKCEHVLFVFSVSSVARLVSMFATLSCYTAYVELMFAKICDRTLA